MTGLLLIAGLAIVLCGWFTPTAGAAMTFGVNVKAHANHATLGLVASVKANIVREQFRWSESEPIDRQFDWTRADADIAAASRAGIEIQAVLNGAPGWALKPGTPRGLIDTLPTSLDDYAEWVREFAARYGTKGSFWRDNPTLRPMPIRVWQIWNEPNVAWVWTGGVPNPARYADLLKRSRNAIRSVDPSARIVAAGVAAAGGGNLVAAPEDFLKKTWRALGSNTATLRYDWDVHAYSTTAVEALKILPHVRRLMDANGCAGCWIRVGEWGWSSGAKRTGNFDFSCAGSEREQATMTEQYLRGTLPNAARYRLLSMTWYSWSDNHKEIGYCFKRQGLVTEVEHSKPVLAVFRKYANSIPR